MSQSADHLRTITRFTRPSSKREKTLRDQKGYVGIWELRDGKTYVYFIGADEGPVKIGLSNAPIERLACFQLGCPVKLSILAKVEGSPGMEKEYHRRFAHSRSHGEWFHRTPELLAEIAKLNPRIETLG